MASIARLLFDTVEMMDDDKSLSAPNLADWKPQRGPDGKFLPGQGGKPKGARNAISRRAIAEIQSMVDDAFFALKDNIEKHDQRAIEFVLSRVLPAGRLVEIDMTADGISDAVSEGHLTLDELKQIASAVSSLKSIGELDELKEEVRQLRELLQG